MGDGSLRLGYGQGRAGKRANSRKTVSESRYLGAGKRETHTDEGSPTNTLGTARSKRARKLLPRVCPKRVLLLDPKCPVSFARGKIGRAETKMSLV